MKINLTLFAIVCLIGTMGIAKAYATPRITPHPNEGQMVTDWHVTITENGIDRSFDLTSPETYPFGVDPLLASGWFCEVRPLVVEGHVRRRWLTCTFSNRTQVSVRAECLDNHTSFAEKEFWLGDHVGVALSCNSAISP